jgi:DoxX-like family
MTSLPAPTWPVLVLAAITAVDGVLCLKPVGFIAQCFRNVGLPRRYWRLMPVIKFAATAGLLAGVWVPALGVLTTGCLVLYFLVAIAMHIRMRDLGRNLFLNATGMLTICTATLVVCFLM